MKKLIFVSLIAIFLFGCHKAELENKFQNNIDLLADIEAFNTIVKTSMSPDNQVVWSSGDCISVFRGRKSADKYELIESGAGSSSAVFKWVSSDHEEEEVEYPCNIAFYPYTEGLMLSRWSSESYIIENVVLPGVQSYMENSFGNGAFPMVAVTENREDHKLNFKNVLGAMKLQLKGTQIIKSIKVRGTADEKLSGTATIIAYSDHYDPEIQMAEDAISEVVLDCGDGVQLSETEAANFYVALPPVLFEKGFTVIMSTVDEKQYTVSAKTANTIYRSSILVMPELNLSTDKVFLNKSSLLMMPNTSYKLIAEIDQTDDPYSEITWTSSDNTVATVDNDGLVTARGIGNATITASTKRGGKACCSIGVKAPVEFAASDFRDYVDEYGVNHGKGVAVAGIIWAPVNCGYEPADGDYNGYPYGKLYQWGRKYGQGYGSEDATYPSGEYLRLGPLRRSGDYVNTFFYGSVNWSDRYGDNWNPDNKADCDPCPSGWRVPTIIELYVLTANYLWDNINGQNGASFVGEYTYCEGLPQVFLPAAGARDYYKGDAYGRGRYGYYWSSNPTDGTHLIYYGAGAHNLMFDEESSRTDGESRAMGFSVRCVQE